MKDKALSPKEFFDSNGQLTTIDTTHLQNFMVEGWCERLAEWDITCECWQVNCNDR